MVENDCTGCSNKNNPLEKIMYFSNGSIRISVKLSDFISEY